MVFEIKDDNPDYIQMRVGFNGSGEQFTTDLKIQAASAGIGTPNGDYRGLIINVDSHDIGNGSAVLWLHEDALPEFFTQCLRALDQYKKYDEKFYGQGRDLDNGEG